MSVTQQQQQQLSAIPSGNDHNLDDASDVSVPNGHNNTNEPDASDVSVPNGHNNTNEREVSAAPEDDAKDAENDSKDDSNVLRRSKRACSAQASAQLDALSKKSDADILRGDFWTVDSFFRVLSEEQENILAKVEFGEFEGVVLFATLPLPDKNGDFYSYAQFHNEKSRHLKVNSMLILIADPEYLEHVRNQRFKYPLLQIILKHNDDRLSREHVVKDAKRATWMKVWRQTNFLLGDKIWRSLDDQWLRKSTSREVPCMQQAFDEAGKEFLDTVADSCSVDDENAPHVYDYCVSDFKVVMALFGPLNVHSKDVAGVWVIDNVSIKFSRYTDKLVAKYRVMMQDKSNNIHVNN